MIDATYGFLSSLERVVWDWLTKHKIPFTTQQKMFGIGEIGSAVVDFILTEQVIAIRTMGGYWHTGLVPEARDLLGKEKLIEAGYIVVDIWETNLTTPEKVGNTMRLALQGMEVPR